MINELLNFLELQNNKLSNLRNAGLLDNLNNSTPKNEFASLKFVVNNCYDPFEHFTRDFHIFTFLQYLTIFLEGALLGFLIFIIINLKSFKKTIQNIKNLGPLVSLLIMSLKVTFSYFELIPVICFITIYFILKTEGFTDSEESFLTIIFCVFLVLSSKLNNDPMFFASLILFGYFKLLRKFYESHQLIVVDESQKATVIKTNVLFARPFRDLAVELGGRFAGEHFSALPKTRKKVAYAFRRIVQKSHDNPMALKLLGGAAIGSGYGVCNHYYKKKQMFDVEHIYHRSVEDRINLDKFDKDTNSVEGLMLKKDFLSALQARKDLVPLNIHEAVLKKGVEKSGDVTFMELVNEGFEVLKAVG
jgi:hypothetical protein